MSHASTVLARLTDRGITVRLDGNVLVPRGPRSALSGELLDEVRRHKPAIVELLQWRAPWTESCHASGVLLSRHDDLAQRIADLADAYIERIAIVLEAGDLGDTEARRIAEAEIGAAFVRAFLPAEVAASDGPLIAPAGTRQW